MIVQNSTMASDMLLLDLSRLTQQAKQELLDFYQFLLHRSSVSLATPFPPTVLESPTTRSVYQGRPLSIEDMNFAIEQEAGHHRRTLIFCFSRQRVLDRNDSRECVKTH